MEPDGPEEWHVAPVNDGGFLGSGDDEEDDAEPWWDEADAGTGERQGGSVRRAVFGRNSPRLTVAVAVAAAVLGVVAGLALVRLPSSSPSPGAAGPAASSGPSQNGGGNGGLPPLQGSGNGTLEMQVVGKVTAVSTTSITVGGDSGSMTARFTAATKFSGRVHDAAGIKDGDQVAVVAAGMATTTLTVTSIQDPAS